MITLIYCEIHSVYSPMFCLIYAQTHLIFLENPMSFKRTTHSYLLQMSIIRNKKRNPLLSLLINCIPAKSILQTLSLKDEYTFRFSNFLIIGSCNSSPNSWFHIISFLTPLPEDFLLKNL